MHAVEPYPLSVPIYSRETRPAHTTDQRQFGNSDRHPFGALIDIIGVRTQTMSILRVARHLGNRPRVDTD